MFRVFLGNTRAANITTKKKNILGWHVCRMKLARNICSRRELSHEKCSEIFPDIFEPLFRGFKKFESRKDPAKFCEVSKRGWREGVGEQQEPKCSKEDSQNGVPLFLVVA